MSGTERVSGSEVGQLQLQAAVFNYTVFFLLWRTWGHKLLGSTLKQSFNNRPNHGVQKNLFGFWNTPLGELLIPAGFPYEENG